MKKVIKNLSIEKVDVRVGKDTWVRLGDKPIKGDRVMVALAPFKNDDGARVYVRTYMDVTGFNALALHSRGSVATLLLDDELVELEGKVSAKGAEYFTGAVNAEDVKFKDVEVDEDIKEFDFAFGQVELVKPEKKAPDRNSAKL